MVMEDLVIPDDFPSVESVLVVLPEEDLVELV